MSRVYVHSHHLEPDSRTLTGLTLHVQFEGGSAEVSMLDMPGIPEPEQDAGIRAAILRLGEAIVQVAKDSHGQSRITHEADRTEVDGDRC
jgi:hypothetical protein